jgi:ATP-binding cassette subfamily B protein
MFHVQPDKMDRQYSDRVLLRRIGDYFRPHKKPLIIVTVLIVVMSACGTALPIMISAAIERVGLSGGNTAIFVLPLAVIGVGLFHWTANLISRMLSVRAIADIILKLRLDSFRAAINHDLAFFDGHDSGKLVSRITSDTNEFSQLVGLATGLVSRLLQVAVMAVILLCIDWRLSAVIFGMVPMILLLGTVFRKFSRRFTHKGMRATADVNGAVKESIAGIAVAKNFSQEEAISEEFSSTNSKAYKVNLARGLVLNMLWPLLDGLRGIGYAGLVYTGALLVAKRDLSIGDWFLFIQSLNLFMFPIMHLASFWSQIQTGLAASERVFSLIDYADTVKQTGDRQVDRLKGDVKLESIDFRYRENEQIMTDFNLHIKPGETVAFVGHTGAGKSTVARLLARFYEFQNGQLSVDDVDIREYDLTSYRSRLGIVSQVPFLFAGTVLENVRYGRTDLSAEEIEALAMSIGDGEWIKSLPKGLDSEVGERGRLLSIGQRQLVSLIRVLAQKPDIFILDEATASIDPFTEMQIQQVLEMIMSDSTSILIAHRLSTVRHADRIIVLADGAIVDEGKHDVLLAKSGYYSDLYNKYFRHQSLDYVETMGQYKAKHSDES